MQFVFLFPNESIQLRKNIAYLLPLFTVLFAFTLIMSVINFKKVTCLLLLDLKTYVKINSK